MTINQSMGGLPYRLPAVVQADPYGPSPLVTDLSMRTPGLFRLASERGPAPTLFATGDLPPFTASGVDPQLLTGLPYHWRHAAASTPDGGQVLAWLEQCAMDPDACGRIPEGQPHPGLMDYRSRMERWTAGLRAPDVTLEELSGQEIYPDSIKTPAMRKAEADAAAEVKRQAEVERLRGELAAESAKWPRNYDAIDRLADQLATARAGGSTKQRR